MKVGVVDIEVTDRMWFGHVWRRLQDALDTGDFRRSRGRVEGV